VSVFVVHSKWPLLFLLLGGVGGGGGGITCVSGFSPWLEPRGLKHHFEPQNVLTFCGKSYKKHLRSYSISKFSFNICKNITFN
jgi:hypothetical protein